jgi:hypothetical protein
MKYLVTNILKGIELTIIFYFYNLNGFKDDEGIFNELIVGIMVLN